MIIVVFTDKLHSVRCPQLLAYLIDCRSPHLPYLHQSSTCQSSTRPQLYRCIFVNSAAPFCLPCQRFAHDSSWITCHTILHNQCLTVLPIPTPHLFFFFSLFFFRIEKTKTNLYIYILDIFSCFVSFLFVVIFSSSVFLFFVCFVFVLFCLFVCLFVFLSDFCYLLL